MPQPQNPHPSHGPQQGPTYNQYTSAQLGGQPGQPGQPGMQPGGQPPNSQQQGTPAQPYMQQPTQPYQPAQQQPTQAHPPYQQAQGQPNPPYQQGPQYQQTPSYQQAPYNQPRIPQPKQTLAPLPPRPKTRFSRWTPDFRRGAFNAPGFQEELKRPFTYPLLVLVAFWNLFHVVLGPQNENPFLLCAGLAANLVICYSLVLRQHNSVYVVTVVFALSMLTLLSPLGVLVAATWVLAQGRVWEAIYAVFLATAAIATTTLIDMTRAPGRAFFDTEDTTTGEIDEATWSFYVILAVLSLTTTCIVGLVRRSYNVPVETQEHIREVSELKEDLNRRTEREIIAREIHDTVAHQLSHLSLQTGLLETTSQDPEVNAAAQDMRRTVQRTLNEMRGLVASLRDSSSEGYTGVREHDLSGLQQLIAQARDVGATISADITVSPYMSLPEAVSRAAYRITQESITNAMKYSDSSPIFVRVFAQPGPGIFIEVINQESPDRDLRSQVFGTGAGLAGMKERAENLEGTFTHSSLDGFWRTTTYLPWAAQPSAPEEAGRGEPSGSVPPQISGDHSEPGGDSPARS